MAILTQTSGAASGKPRIDWVDFSKGLCIILVVLLHANNGIEEMFKTETFLHDFVAWARPFRMPDFFLIAGLFLSRRIDTTWRPYLDKKVVHFAYFYIIWMSIWYVLKLPDFIGEDGLTNALWRYPLSYVQPLGTLWFIYMLAVFFVVAKVLRGSPVWLVWGVAAVLHAMHIETGARVIDEFSARFVFFYSGYVFAPIVFSIADRIDRQKTATIFAGLTIWAIFNAKAVFGGWSYTPPIEIVLGYAGTIAVITFGILFTRFRFANFIGYSGQNSIVVFLSYFLFMAGTRIVILKLGLPLSPGAITVIITAAGVVGPLIALRLIKDTPLIYVYRRHPVFFLKDPEFGITDMPAIGEPEKLPQ